MEPVTERDVADKIRILLHKNLELPIELLEDDAKLRELGVESIKVLRTILAIEEHYDIELDNEVVFKAETVRDIARAVVQLKEG